MGKDEKAMLIGCMFLVLLFVLLVFCMVKLAVIVFGSFFMAGAALILLVSLVGLLILII